MKEAKWIWLHLEDKADEYVEFFDELDYCDGEAVLNLSCDSNYALYINDELSGFGQYADLPWYKVYDNLNITPHLRQGKNQIKIIVWYYGHDYFTYYKGKPGLIYELTVDGRVECFSSERTWCMLSGSYINYLKKEITNQILGYSFRYDTRRKQANHTHAVEQDGITYDLHMRPVKFLELKETSYGRRLSEYQKQTYDLGCERVGFLHIKFKAPSGTLVNIAYGEHLADGCVRRFIDTYPLREGILPRDYSVEVIGSGEWEEYLNPFRRLGCRYLEISAEQPVEIEFIGLRETVYPVAPVPFRAENELRQKIYDTCVRTLQLCMHEHYEDCPWREQVLYVLDSRNQMLCGYEVFGEYDFPRASLRLLALNQSFHGLITSSAPNNDRGAIPSFALHYIMQMREYIEHSGDLSLAEEFYPKMSETLKVCVERIEDGLIPIFYEDPGYFNFYEWSDDMQSELFRQDEKRFDIQLNCILSLALQNMEYISERLHRFFPYKGLAEKLNRRIDEYYYNPETELYHTNELSNALAVLCGAAQGGRRKRVCEILARPENGLVPVTLSMIGFKYDALLSADKKYKEVILEDIDRIYGGMLERGATSFWETIEGEAAFNRAGSLCHGWSAMPAYYYHLFSKM